MRSARLNRWRRKFGLPPLPRPGQVWHVEYSGWNNTRKHAYYLLLRLGDSYTHKGKTTECWHVFDLEKGCFYGSNEQDMWAMPFEYKNGEERMPFYRLITEAP